MVQRNRFNGNRKKSNRSNSHTPMLRELPVPAEKKPPTVYGKAFVVLEDMNRKTFVFKAGAWIPHSMTIAECRVDCLVNELPQKVNRMTRYEIRCPV